LLVSCGCLSSVPLDQNVIFLLPSLKASKTGSVYIVEIQKTATVYEYTFHSFKRNMRDRFTFPILEDLITIGEWRHCLD
jgi:hypothetical protein